MADKFCFPFGSELKKVEQKDKTSKNVFVLGVYASAVHAKWVGPDGKRKVTALAVASEPEIFWRGDNAEEIISAIKIPGELGRLEVPANPDLNGPSGRALDELFLSPLGYSRNEAWLCDLLPYSRVNEKQRAAIDKHYTPDIIRKYGLPPATIPDFDKSELDNAPRRAEILAELEASGASKIILLGDLPIRWFLSYHDSRYTRLAQFGQDDTSYGQEHEVRVNGRDYRVIPLCHPRQAGRLGTSSTKWGKLHESWIRRNR